MLRLLRCWLLATGLAVIFTAGLPLDSAGQLIGAQVPTWVPNGAVNAVLVDGEVAYAGGSFDQVGPLTGAFAVVDQTDDTDFTTGAGVMSNVRLVAADGAGGWFVATDDFGNGPRPAGLIHVRADGTRDPVWTPPTIDLGALNALAASSGRLFLGGTFTTVNGVARAGLVALDASSGAVLPWDANLSFPSFGVSVFTLEATPTRVYVGGYFLVAGGAARNRFAILDAASGAVLPGALPASLTDPQIGAIELTSARVYLYGGCRAGGFVVCAYDLDLNPLPGWTFPPTFGLIAASDTALYTLESIPNNWYRVNRLDPATGAALPWTAPEIRGTFPQLLEMEVSGSSLYLGGNFLDVNGQARARVAAVDATSGALASWAPRIGGTVSAMATAGASVAVGGIFETVGGVLRQNLVALDLRTGRPLDTTPPVVASVKALLKIGDVVVVGGERPFTAPLATPDVTAFLATTGAPIPWSLASNGSVDALAADGRRMYLGGRFSLLSGTPRLNLASVDLTTAALTSWNPSPDSSVARLAISSDALFAAGAFNSLIGYGRPGVAAFSTANGEVLPFNPGRAGLVEVNDFGIYRDRVLLAGSPFAGPGQSGFRWVDRISGAPLPLATTVLAAIWDGAQVGDTLYAIGYPTDSSTRGLLMVDLTTGRAAAFDSDIRSSAVSIAASPAYIVVGGGRVFTNPAPSMVVYRAPRAGAPVQMQSAVTGNTVTLGWQPGTGTATTAFLVEAGTTAGGTDVGVFNVGLSTRVAGALGPGTYYVRVRGLGANGAGAASSEVIATVPPTPTAPAAPGTLAASVSGGVVTLSWGAAAGNATSYVIEAGTASGLTNIGALLTGNLDTSWSVPAPPGTYFVRVRAANAFGLGPATNEVTVVVP